MAIAASPLCSNGVTPSKVARTAFPSVTPMQATLVNQDLIHIEQQDDRDNASIASDSEGSEDYPNIPEVEFQRRDQHQAFGEYLKTKKIDLPAENGNLKQFLSANSRLDTQDEDEARDYQQELFEKAKEENIIAVLDTGTGKTLIAALLIKHMLNQESVARSEGRAARWIFFLANSVQLVNQQSRYLNKHLPEPTIQLHGNVNQDLWRQADWKETLEFNRVVVCTPAILQQCLMHGFLKMQQIALIVFDEAHHAKKDHTYSRIMRSYYLKCDEVARPRIFGMTASPVDSKQDIGKTAADLEALLHAKIYTTASGTLPYAARANNVKWFYSLQRFVFDTDLHRQLDSLCSFSEDLRKGFTFSSWATSQLGPWCADYVWYFVFGDPNSATSAVVRKFEQSDTFANIATVEERTHCIALLEKASELVRNRKLEHPVPAIGCLSPKVILLYQKLKDHYQSHRHTRAIVFVEQRLTALILRDLFTKLSIPNMVPGIFLGGASTTKGSLSQRQQDRVLKQFREKREGNINLIFATSVADEGIDIPACNLGIRFDLCTTTIQYMQSRGRARMKNSIFAHMIDETDEQQLQQVDYHIENELYIKSWCQSLPPSRRLGVGSKLARLLARDAESQSFETGTGAICDYGNALVILSRFSASLRHVGAVGLEAYDETIDVDNNMFQYTVRLPQTLTKPTNDLESLEMPQSNVKGCRGQWKANKQLAKRSAAYGCCFLLRRQGDLDENLDSVFHKYKPANANARLAVSRKKSSYAMIAKPSVWENGIGDIPDRLHVAILHFLSKNSYRRCLSPILIMTRFALPTVPHFTIYLEDNTPTTVVIESLPEAFPIDSHQLEILTTFNLNGVFKDVFNKTYENDVSRMSYWIAPATAKHVQCAHSLADLVNFGSLLGSRHERSKWTVNSDHRLWSNKFICDPLSGKHRYFTGKVIPGATIHDPVEENIFKSTQKKGSNIIDFSDSSWKKSKRKKETSYIYDSNQPIYEAECVMTRRNFLEPATAKETLSIACKIAPQTLEISCIEPRFAASCLIWPTIIHRLEAYMIVSEAYQKLDLSEVSADLALESFTKGADLDLDEAEAFTKDANSGIRNYERLEFIGDSLLKMTTTMTIFNRTTCDEEGMHCRRMAILCNQHLFDVSTEKLELFKYVRSSVFNRSTWYPEHLRLMAGRGAQEDFVKHSDMTHELGMKTIADVSEAIIGAAISTSRGTSKPFDLGIKAITTLVQSEDHDVQSWSEIAAMYQAPEWSLLKNDPIANNLAANIQKFTGYDFQNPRLLRSAFTHSSDTNAPVPDLQRLEFLGDAVLDWVCISWLFYNNPSRGPQWLTEHKMAMVSNKFLAALAVVLNFDKLIFASGSKLSEDIAMYADKVRQARLEPNCPCDFWTRLDSPPKTLSDLVESYLGAVLIDSNFNYTEMENFFNNHIAEFFTNIEDYDTYARGQPISFLYKRVQDEYGCHMVSVPTRETMNDDQDVINTAGVMIHRNIVSDSRGNRDATSSGKSAKYAKIRACQKALEMLEGLSREDFRTKYDCCCKFRS